MVRKALQHSWVYLISRCSAISPSPTPTPTVWPLCPRFYQLLLFSSQNAMIEKAMDPMRSFLTKTVSHLVENNVSPPHPGAQSHAWGAGAGVPFTGATVLSGCLFFLGANSSLGCQLEPVPRYSAWGEGEMTSRGPTLAEITGSQVWVICHTYLLPICLFS